MRQGFEDDFGVRSGEFQDHFSYLEDGVLARVPQIHRTNAIIRTLHQRHESVDEVIHITETARLTPIPIDREIVPLESLHDEVADHTPVLGMHVRSIGIKNAGHFDLEVVLTVVIEKQRFRTALPLIVARP